MQRTESMIYWYWINLCVEHKTGPKKASLYVCSFWFNLMYMRKEYTRNIKELQQSQQPIRSNTTKVVCAHVCVCVRITATNNRCEIEQSKQNRRKRLNAIDTQPREKHTQSETQHIGPVLIRRFQHSTMCTHKQHTHTNNRTSHWNRWLAKRLVLSICSCLTLSFQHV